MLIFGSIETLILWI